MARTPDTTSRSPVYAALLDRARQARLPVLDRSALNALVRDLHARRDVLAGADVALGDRSNMLFQNTAVTRGTAAMVVTDTGKQTQMGQIATMLNSVTRTRSPLQRELGSLTKVLGTIAWGAVAFIVRAFQYAWPPLAYSVGDDREAARLYGLVTTYYVMVSGWVVAGLALESRWVLRLLAAPAFFHAYRALPWVALGWALYGLWVVFLVIAVVFGVLAAIVPAVRASRMKVLDAIATE